MVKSNSQLANDYAYMRSQEKASQFYDSQKKTISECSMNIAEHYKREKSLTNLNIGIPAEAKSKLEQILEYGVEEAIRIQATERYKQRRDDLFRNQSAKANRIAEISDYTELD